MRFLLLGGIGYLGGRLAGYLKQQGHYVRVTTRRPKQKVPSWLKADDVLQLDPLNASALNPAFASIETVVNLAAPDETLSSQNPQAALRAGEEATGNIMQSISECPKPPALLYLSTFHVYGANARGRVDERTIPAPAHPYAVGKYKGECVVQIFRQKKVRALCVRLSNAFGAPAGWDVPRWTLVFNDLCRQAVTQKKLILKTAGTQARNFIPMTDTVRAIEFLAMNRDRWPADGVLHLGSDKEWTILEAAKRVAACAKEVLGFLPPVIVPSDAPPPGGQEFQFSIERLEKLGFTWTGAWEEEIKATLQMCKDHA